MIIFINNHIRSFENSYKKTLLIQIIVTFRIITKSSILNIIQYLKILLHFINNRFNITI